jgi:hypothetical protein
MLAECNKENMTALRKISPGFSLMAVINSGAM